MTELPTTLNPGPPLPHGRHFEYKANYYGQPVVVYWTGSIYWPHWRLEVGVHKFCGVPNKCETRASALCRAWWRAKWIKDGTFAVRYQGMIEGDECGVGK